MINQVTIVGRLTNDIEVRKTPSGVSYARFTVACNRRFTSGDQKQADFISCIVWRQQADFIARYARKGSLVGVEGRIQTGNYTDKDGKKVYTTDVVGDNVQLLETKKANEERTGYQSSPEPSYQRETTPYTRSNDDSYSYSDNDEPVLDISTDDLPF